MAEILNLANAILILGTIYFGYTYGFNYGHFILIGFVLCFWNYYGYRDERKKLYEADIRLKEAKADWYRRRDMPMYR